MKHKELPADPISKKEPALTRRRFLLALGLLLPPFAAFAVLVANYAAAAGHCSTIRRPMLIGFAAAGLLIAAGGFLLGRAHLDSVLPGDRDLSKPEKRLKFAEQMNLIMAAFSAVVLCAFIVVILFLRPCEP